MALRIEKIGFAKIPKMGVVNEEGNDLRRDSVLRML